jgi:hypothetical protein
MIRRGLLSISAAAVLYTIGTPVDAKKPQAAPIVREPWENCSPDVDSYRDWLPNRLQPDGEMTAVAKDAIHEVSVGQRARASALLENHEVIALTGAQAMELVGSGEMLSEGTGNPFLIRNVVPSFVDSLGSPAIGLNRVGSKLVIRAGLYGCGGFLKNPLVVFLPFTPTQVDMQVSAIW